MHFKHSGSIYKVAVDRNGDRFDIDIDGKLYNVSANEIRPGLLQISGEEGLQKFVVSPHREERHVFLKGGVFKICRIDPSKASVVEAEGDLTSPITGKVVKLEASPGDHLEEGKTIMVLEAMKMEYQIKAPFSGTLKKIHFTPGQGVEMGALLADMENDENGDRKEGE